ncbi:antibiotic biosynthesis monooxygenase [Salegentibacter sp. LM13S]|uniref:putative quinol monooxygenase n=1 Tax=Salegentibacter lacus TaxID=2873599 RepID=UPI001CC8F156|nr:antibiotic biosynthesis monooxygenase [Salegentibacter lacus]MBZ9631368.1 antibiotic biosynthesis monooxygenase [Salegentibacter lacus]
MIHRIVKMEFDPNKIEVFLSNFEENKSKIRASDGCFKLELLRDQHNTNIFFTYSYWTDEASLEKYRNSELFKNVWAKTKVLFNAKPVAWSTNVISSE